MNKSSRKTFSFFCLVIGLILFYVFNHFSGVYQLTTGATSIHRIINTIKKLEVSNWFYPTIYTSQNSIMFGLIGMLIALFIWTYFCLDYHEYRYGEEHGSASWGNKNDRKRIMKHGKKSTNNIILSRTEQLCMDTRFTFLNNNVLGIGRPGSGKTRYLIKPNLMQGNTSYAIIDPKGTLFHEIGDLLQNIFGYILRVFNTVNFENSMHYNPFHYINKEEDILSIANTIIANTTNPEKKGGDQFWDDAEKLLYSAIIGYIWKYASEEERNIETLMYILSCITVKEDNDDYVNAVDMLFEELERANPTEFCVLQYKEFKNAAGKTVKSILATKGARLAPFNITRIREITRFDDLFLEDIGASNKKIAFFIVVNDTDPTFNFLAALLESQLIQVTKETADRRGGTLNHPFQIWMDEAGNIGKIINLEKAINTVRSRLISINPIVQNISQFVAIYGKEATSTIIGGCASILFLGSGENEVTKFISEKLGKQTINVKNISHSKGRQEGYSTSEQTIGRDLMDPAEVALLDANKCIVMIDSVRPFLSEKYILRDHKNYKYTYDYAASKAHSWNPITRLIWKPIAEKRYFKFDMEDLNRRSVKAHKEIISVQG